MPRFITDAPERFDGFGTHTVEYLPYQHPRGYQVRRVEIDPEHVTWQRLRYSSGLFMALRSDAELAQLVALGLYAAAPVALEFEGTVAQDAQLVTLRPGDGEPEPATAWSVYNDDRSLDDYLQALEGKNVRVRIEVLA